MSAFTSPETCNAHVNCGKSVFVRCEQGAPEGMMIMTRVLVVEDSPDIARLVQRSLLLEGYEVDVANDGRGALAVVRDTPPDLIVLDLMLPDIDGMEICRRVRAMEAAYEQPPVPVLMLTALDAVPDRVSGLDAGADDYVPKPFAITELMARVRSLLRRSRAPEVRSKQREIITFEDLTLDPGARTVFRGDREVILTAKQFDLLAALMEHPNQVMSYDTVMQRVWGGQFRGESNVLAVTVSTVRKALEEGGEPRLIQTVRGVGYVLRQPKGKAAAAA
jgi:two-component system, OmpR family, response regulator MprA